MKYTIVRDGEEFGPYSQEDLPRFVADGNVVPTDLARPVDGGKTVAVAELLRTTGTGAPSLPVLDHADASAQPANRRPIALAAVAIIALALLAGAAWYFLREDDQGITTAARYLPANTLAVFTLHVDNLAEKAGLEEILREQFGGEIAQDNPFLQNLGNPITKMPRKLGLSTDQPLFVFALPGDRTGKSLGGFILPVQSQRAVERGIKEALGTLAAAPLLSKLKNVDGYRAFTEEGLPFALGFNDDVLVMIGSEEGNPNLANRLRAIFRKETNLPKGRADFGRHLKRKFDAGLWMNLPEILRHIEGIPAEFLGDPSRLGNLTSSLEIRFDNGTAQARIGLTYDQHKLGDWAGGKLDSALLAALPEKPLAIIAQSVNIDSLKKYIQKNLPGDLREEINDDLEDATDLNLDSLLGTLKGSVMIALNDLRPNPLLDIPSPDFFVGFSVKDSPKLDQLLARAKENNGRLAALQVIRHPGAIFLCSDYTALQLKENSTGTSGPAHKLLRDHGAGGYVDFARLAALGEKLNMPEEAIAIMEKLENLTLTGDTHPGEMEYVLTLTLKDKQRNSLRQLGNLSGMILNEVFTGGRGDTTFDENDLPPLKD